jgi:hypothetical protein
VAWLWYQQPSAPGNLIVIGWSMRQRKDFFQILKPAKIIINLIKASILFILSPLPTRLPPERSNTAPPAFPLRSPPVPRPVQSLTHRARVNLFGCCVQLSGKRMKNTVRNDASSSNLKWKPMTKTIGLHWLQRVTKHVPATDEASVHRAQLRVKPLYLRACFPTARSPTAR